MLQFISWQDFLTTSLLVVGIYYGIVVIAYYRRDILSVTRRNRGMVNPGNVMSERADQGSISGRTEATPESGEEGKDSRLPEMVLSELKEIILNATTDEVEREDLLGSVRQGLKKYKHLKRTSYEESISDAIEAELSEGYGIQLTKDERMSLWI